MAERMFVKPTKSDFVIRDPHTKRRLPKEGGHVPRNGFWLRRLLDKDVSLAEPPKVAPAAEVTTTDSATEQKAGKKASKSEG